ncbi:MAG: right-handed parallel beta-helix repeat-containing protein [Solirubrobacterales bacterium]
MRFGLVLTAAVLAATIALLTGSNPHGAVGANLTATPSTLGSVFSQSVPNETIELQSGDYGRFGGGMKSGRVTLRAAPGAKVTMDLDFSPAANITVDGVDLDDVVIAERSHDITIRNSDITGQVILRDLTDSNVTLENNVHRDWDKCGNCGEGRIFIPGDLSRPSGITIAGSEFVGGVSDGILNGSNGTRIIHNYFHDLEEGTPNGVHTDAIQLYGSKNTVIKGNFIRDVPDAIMAPDGTDHERIENNVIAGDRGGYPYAITIWSDDGSVIRHNTFADGACMFNLRCGIISIGSKSGQPAGRGTVIEDNIANDISIGDGQASASRSHNMLFGGSPRGPGEFRGKPVFVGGSAPDTRSGYALAPRSPGVGKAGDGLDVGAIIARDTACADARGHVKKVKRRVAGARRALSRASGRKQRRKAKAKLRRAKRQLRDARHSVRQFC